MKPAPTFFHVPLERLTQKSLFLMLTEALSRPTQTLIATPNPEMLLAAYRREEVRDALLRFHKRIPDGFGLSLLSLLTGQGSLNRFPGVDVFLDICRIAANNKQHILLLGGWNGAGFRAKEVLEAAFPHLRVTVIEDMTINYENGTWEQPDDLLERIAELRPDVLAVALGGAKEQKQERWIVEFAPTLPSVRIAIGVGGTLDMISGRRRRAPSLFRGLGIEWLWRLMRQPTRLPRIFNAVIVFPVCAIFDTMRTPKR